MTPGFLVFNGIACFFLGLGYLYWPKIIYRMNAIIRDYFFNDAHIALDRRNWGRFFLLLSVLFLYVGYIEINR